MNQTLKDCDTCSQNIPQVAHPPLRPLVSREPMEILMTDFFSPLPPDPVTGDRYLYFMLLYIFVFTFKQDTAC